MSLSSSHGSFEISFLLHNIRFLNFGRTDLIIFYFLRHASKIFIEISEHMEK